MQIKLQVDERNYELTQETFRLILNMALHGFGRLQRDPECKITKAELHAMDVIQTFQFRHRELI